MIDHPELGYEQSPLIQLRWATAAEEIVNRGIKWIHDGGALNPRGLYEETKKYLNSKGLLDKVKISWVEGDNVYDRVKTNLSKNDGGEVYPHLDISGQTLNAAFKNEDVKKIVSANAYSESTQPDLGIVLTPLQLACVEFLQPCKMVHKSSFVVEYATLRQSWHWVLGTHHIAYPFLY